MDPILSDYIDSWLATKDSWCDPTDLQAEQGQDKDKDKDLSPPLPSSTFQAVSYPFQSFGRTRARKRKRSMNSETASNATGESRTGATNLSTNSLQNRPDLRPTPPSTRSSSPVRTVLAKLKLAKPSIRFYQPDIRIEQPPPARRLKSILITSVSSKVIPHSLQFEASSHLFEDPSVVYSDTYIDTLWQTADKIYNEARRCYDNNLQESAWVKLVNNVLESAQLGEPSSILCTHSIQTETIDPILLPQHASQSFAKKADLAYIFDSGHPTIASAIEPVYEAYPDTALSQMTDAYSSAIPMVCCLEVNERGGDFNEAILQLGVWCAAGLERLRRLWTLKSARDLPEDMPPFLGWTVVGHDWKLFISWKNADGNVVSSFPFIT